MRVCDKPKCSAVEESLRARRSSSSPTCMSRALSRAKYLIKSAWGHLVLVAGGVGMLRDQSVSLARGAEDRERERGEGEQDDGGGTVRSHGIPGSNECNACVEALAFTRAVATVKIYKCYAFRCVER